MRFGWASVTERRLTTLAWIGALLLVAVGVFLSVRNEAGFRHDVERQTNAQADILAASVTAALSFDDRLAMRQYVDALKANPGISAAAIYDARGRQVVKLRLGDAPPAPRHAGPVRTTWRDGRVEAMRPASEQGQVLGYVYLETERDSFADALSRHTGVSLLTLMGLLLLVLVSAAAARLQDRAQALSLSHARLSEEMAARAEVEEALRQSQKMEALGQLTGGIAHDFNNLLQVIQGALELIGRKASDPEKVRAWAANGLQAADRGAALTRQLLAFSRTQKLDLKPFVVSELVADMRELLIRTLGPDIELVLDLDPDRLRVVSDRTQLELAILNLVINARDAMSGGGRLSIRTGSAQVEPGDPVLEPGEYVALSVSDTGEGMPAEVAARAFDPFFTTKGTGKGTGLGLSQVYGVARQAGGGAQIVSAPGQGATVTVLLRRSEQPAAAAENPRAPEPVLAPRAGALVLVVDDDNQVRALIADTLQLLGYRVLEADSGAAALATLKSARPDAMVIDFAMPQMNGAEAADRARALRPDLPIIFASGHADTEAIKAAVGDQAPTLRKPFDMNELARTLAAAIARTPAPENVPQAAPEEAR
jgi:signal transduction histidine kinase/CheY-like chemotaxis protein